MTQHVYVIDKNQPITFPDPKNGTFCHVHFPVVNNQQLVHIYHYMYGTWAYLSFYVLDID